MARVVGGQVALRLGAQPERAPDALYVDADHARPLGLAPEGGDRQAGEVAQERLRAVMQRRGDLAAQLLEVELAALGGVAPGLLLAAGVLAHALAQRRRLGRAEEEALEDELEDAPLLL